MTRADDTPVASAEGLPDGTPIFERPVGYGFSLIIEGRPGGTHAPVGLSTFDVDDPSSLPDLQIEVDRPLGDGSTAVCDDSLGMFGGVPAVNPPDFSPIPAVADPINDFACRFKDQTGSPGGRTMDPCILFADGQYGFGDQTSTAQFCGQISSPFGFPTGDTQVSVRVRDTDGHLSAIHRFIVRIDG